MLLEPQGTRYDLKWRMFGIPTRVHPLFWLTTVVLGWTKRDTELWVVLVWTACVFVSILVHEFGHALTAKRYGAQGLRVVLYGLGGLAISEGGLTRRQRVVELFMGPGAGFILYGIVLGIELAWPQPFEVASPRLAEITQTAIHFLKYINLVWGIVNLFPIYPLDGGQIAREWFEARDRMNGTARSLRFSFFVAIACAAAALTAILAEKLGYYLPSWIPLVPDGYIVLFFGVLALLCWQLSRPEALAAEKERQIMEHREPWERDPDWWKK